MRSDNVGGAGYELSAELRRCKVVDGGRVDK